MNLPANASGRLSVQHPSAQHFAAAVCHNCGVALSTPHCGNCGQKRATRFNVLSVGSEAWQNYRLFELDIVKGALRLLVAPGIVAREYVLGARKKHVHPLKLLLIAIGVLLLVLAQSAYLDSQNAHISKAMAMVRAYGNWSFSLGIVAIVTASWSVLSWRRPFNITEHLVLAVYVHFLIIVASIANLLPILVFRTPEFLAAHKHWSGYYMHLVEAAILAIAFSQFFALHWCRDSWRLLLAICVFSLCKALLLRLFAIALVKLVIAQHS
jgi:hypothetical protein